MAGKLTHTAAFAHFGTVPRNVQWSWSARSDDGRTVVVTLWQDLFTRKDGRATYSRPAFAPDRKRPPGLKELIENLVWSRDHLNGRFNVIIAKAKDVNASPRSIDECFPTKMIMRITHLDPETGAFTAELDNG